MLGQQQLSASISQNNAIKVQHTGAQWCSTQAHHLKLPKLPKLLHCEEKLQYFHYGTAAGSSAAHCTPCSLHQSLRDY
jgi:hypothetical protein